MIKKIKITIIVLVAISFSILTVLFLQDRTRKLEDRKYKNINKILITVDSSDINFYKSEDENVRVVVYGTKKDEVKMIEGNKNITIFKNTGNNICFLNCKNVIDIYIPIPSEFDSVDIKTDEGNINTNDLFIKNIIVDTQDGNVKIDKTNMVNIISNTGNISINELTSNANSSIKTDTGNVYINTSRNSYISVKSVTGYITIPVFKEKQDFTLKIETNEGNIDIDHHENKSE